MNLLLIILAGIGLTDAGYIIYKKRRKESLVCVFGTGTCDEVVNGKYNSLAGVPNEVLGSIYYIGVIITTIFLPQFLTHWFILFAAMGACVMSALLVGLQTFILKNWCEYCLLSAGINLGIFVVVLILGQFLA